MDQLRFLDDICFELLRDDAQEHRPEHSRTCHKLGSIIVQKLLPSVHVSRDFGDLCASLVFAQYLNASLFNHVSLTSDIFKDSAPHLKAVSLFTISTTHLFPLTMWWGNNRRATVQV